MEETSTCSICNKTYTGYGNNAQPVNDGRCCDECNDTVVLKARIESLLIRFRRGDLFK